MNHLRLHQVKANEILLAGILTKMLGSFLIQAARVIDQSIKQQRNLCEPSEEKSGGNNERKAETE